MPVNKEAYQSILGELQKKNVTLVAVSKTKSTEEILELYHLGQRDFGENYVQELSVKASQLPKDIRWHFIGHLQTNKVKQIASFVHLVHSVDTLKLLMEIEKQGLKNNRMIDCLLQVHIAREETKFGLDEHELISVINMINSSPLINTRLTGLMGMASFVEDPHKIRTEFMHLKSIFDKHAAAHATHFQFSVLSMGMSADYNIALEAGSTMVRIGSLLFGSRNP